MGFARSARTSLLRHGGRRAITGVKRGLKTINPRVHSKLNKLTHRAKSYVSDVKDLGATLSRGKRAVLGAATLDPFAAADVVKEGKSAFKKGKALIGKAKGDIASVRREAPGAKKFLKRKAGEIQSNISNPNGGKQPRISGDSLSRMVRSAQSG